MGCDSGYMNPFSKEIEISKVACLLDELDGLPWNKAHWSGYHPKVYGKSFNADAMVSELCSRLSGVDVAKHSLEMQMWWRDHQRADAERRAKES